MKNSLETVYGSIGQGTLLDLACLKALRSKSDGELRQTRVELAECYSFATNNDIMIFGELEFNLLKGISNN